MPWEGPLQQIVDSITGPVVQAAAIIAVVLFGVGSGPVRGFAITHAIGILTTVFTAYTVTRFIVSLWVGWAKPKEVPL